MKPSTSAGRWWILGLLAIAELFGMSLWFSASAVAPRLAELWQLDLRQTGWLTAMVQIGFVAGTALAAVLNLADVVSSRRYFAICAVLAAAVNLGLIGVRDFGAALALRFFTGLFLAGVYPPAMKMIATWFATRRGLAIGTIVGALTLGKASPYLFKWLGGMSLRGVVSITSALALIAAVLVGLCYREGPHAFARRPFRFGLAASVMRHRPTRLAIAGYLGHMWELYAMWVWIPAFLAASLKAGGQPAELADLLAFGAIAAGAAGCLFGGWRADRVGRERFVNEAMAISGACCLLIGACFGASPWLLAPITWLWGFFVVADSAQFSALVTEVCPSHAVGTALTLQTSLGFLLTTLTIGLVSDIAAHAGWRLAFPVLALGPLAGILAISSLRRLRADPAGSVRHGAPR